jgi:hypothetical protein
MLMDALNKLSLGRKLVLGGGLLLFIDTFLPWQKVSIGPVSATANGWHGFWGVLLGLMTIAIVLWAGAKAFGVALPAVVPDGLATLALGALIALFAILKTVTESYRGWASYVGIILGIAIAAGAWFVFQDSGETLPRMATAPTQPPANDEEPPSNLGGTTPD